MVIRPSQRKLALPHVQMFIGEQPIFDLALPEAESRRWFHVCSSWDSVLAQWHVYVDGAVRSWGKRPQVGLPNLTT